MIAARQRFAVRAAWSPQIHDSDPRPASIGRTTAVRAAWSPQIHDRASRDLARCQQRAVRAAWSLQIHDLRAAAGATTGNPKQSIKAAWILRIYDTIGHDALHRLSCCSQGSVGPSNPRQAGENPRGTRRRHTIKAAWSLRIRDVATCHGGAHA